MIAYRITRRLFLKISAFLLGSSLSPWSVSSVNARKVVAMANTEFNDISGSSTPSKKLGVGPDGLSYVYMARNATPEENMTKVMSMMGGINRYIGPNDIVVLKPNAQWWNQGMTNTDGMKAFIDLVLAIHGFAGEVIIAENHQIQDDNSRGWTTEKRNGQYNLNELIEYYQSKGFENVTKYHWHNGGQCVRPLQHDACCGRIVKRAEDGDGYVWMDDCYYTSPEGRRCLMSYPIFTSKYSGITIDLKNGAWKDGKYLDRKVRFINFSALNHHSRYAGVTASVKNLMGVVDMTCGFPGDAPAACYNVHHIGVSENIKWLKKKIYWRLAKLRNARKLAIEEFFCRKFYYAGGTIGTLMRDVRMPDLNIITAEYVGWGHRTNNKKSAHTRALAASKDPVALDLVATEKILLPVTPRDKVDPEGKSFYKLNDPKDKNGPFFKFLYETHQQGIGNITLGKIKLKEYDFSATV
jgi:hypothetical protein